MSQLRRLFAALILIVAVTGVAEADGRAIVPVVGSAAGANGANFRTEIQLHNPGTGVMRGSLMFLPQSLVPPAGGLATLDYEIGPKQTIRFADVIASIGGSGLGSLDVLPFEGGRPTIVVRAFDDQGNFGTRGLMVPVLDESEAPVLGFRFALVAPADLARYRFNIGVRTLGESNTVLRVVEHDPAGATVGEPITLEFPGETFRQQPAAMLLGRDVVAGHTYSFETLSGSAFVYATTVDNQTNDGALQLDRPVNRPPVVADAAVTTGTDEPVTITIQATDPDDDPITFQITSGPAHGTLSDLPVVTKTLSASEVSVIYTPASGYQGPDMFTVLVADDVNGRTSANVVINVGQQTGLPPNAVNDEYTIDEGETLTVNAPGVLANDTDPENDPLIAQLVQGPLAAAKFTFNADGSFVFRPKAGFSGAVFFLYKASDGGAASSVARVTIIVNSLNDPPAAVADAAATTEDAAIAINVLANDSDPEGDPITVVSVNSAGTLGAVTLGVGGVVNYDPTASAALQALGAAEIQTDTFTYTIRDTSGETSTATVTVTVTGVDDLPTAVADAATLLEDAAATAIAVLANDTDVEGDAFTITSVTQGTTGTVVITGGGTGLTYQPNADACGPDSFTYTITGGSTATVTVTVTCVNDEPSFTAGANPTVLEDSGAYDAAWATAISRGPSPTEDGQTLNFSVTGNTNVSLFSVAPAIDPATGNLSFTPAPNANGTADVTVTLSDNGGTSDGGDDTFGPVTLTINVTAQNDNPTAVDDAATVDEDSGATAVGVLANDDDAPDTGETLTITNVQNPSTFGGTVLITGGGTGLTYQPAGNFAGTDTFTYTIGDGNGGTATGTVTVTVTALNDAPLNTVPGAQTVDQLVTLTFSSGNSNLISVFDLEAGNVQVTLGVGSGILTLSGVTGLTFNSGTNGSAAMTFTGTQADVNAALSGLVYDPVDSFEGAATLTITTSDLGQTGVGGTLQDIDTVTITVTAFNDPPLNSLPAAQATPEDTTLVLSTANTNLISISDPDAGGADVQVTLTSTNGTMTLNGTLGLSFSLGDGAADTTMTFTGTISAINTALDGLQFIPTAGFSGAASIQVVTDDLGNTGSGGAQSDTDTLDITVNAVNGAPVNTVPGAQTIDEDATLTFTGATAISVADDAGTNPIRVTLTVSQGTLSLAMTTGLTPVAGADGSATMTFDGTLTDINNALDGLDYNPTANFFGSDTLTVTTNDLGNTGTGGPLSDADTVAITINSVNDAPTDIQLSNSAIDENQASATAVGNLTTTDVDVADTHTYSLVAGTGDTDNASFQIVGGQLQTAAVLDFETKSSYSVRIRTTDNGTGNLTYEEVFTITLNNVNETPTDIALSAASVQENQASGTAVGNFSTTDPDTGDTFTYTLVAGAGSTDNGSFQIVGGQLQTAATFDFETKSSYSIRVRTTDAGGLFFEKQFTISITNQNETPTDITLTDQSIDENSGADAVVGTFSTTDPDAGDTFAYTLVAGAGSTDNALFNIAGNSLRENASFNFEAQSSYSIRVRTTDAGGLFVEEAFTITIVNVPEAPIAGDDAFDTIGNTLLEVDAASSEPQPKVYFSGTLLTGDVDPDTGTNVGLTTTLLASTTGAVVTVNSDGTFTYLPPAGHLAATDTFTYTLSDGALTDTGTVTITLAGRVWYVKNDAAAGGNGRSTLPFDTLVEAQTASLAGDTIYVYAGDGSTTGQNAGIVLKDTQRLLGAGVALTVPVAVNGGPNPTTLLSAGSQPLIDNASATAGDDAGVVVSATAGAMTGIEIRGLNIRGNENAIDATSTGVHAIGVTISDNTIRGTGAGFEGIDVNQGSTSTASTVTMTTNTWVVAGTHPGNAVDIARTAGNLVIVFSGNTNIVSNGGTAVNIAGGAVANTTITGFADNTVHQNNFGTGINISNVTFDGTPGGAYQQVSGGTTTVGISGDGVGASGIVMNPVAGDLAFTDLDVYASNGSGLVVTGSVAAGVNVGTGTGTRVMVPAGVATIQATNGPALNLTNLTADLQLTNLVSTNSGSTGVSLTGVFDGTTNSTIAAATGSTITNASGTDFAISGGNATVTYNGTITDDVGQLVSVASTLGDTISFTGAITDGDDGDGSGISLTSNAAGTTMTFSGGLVLSTGTAAAFTATGGGTVNVCDENPCNAAATGAFVNKITTTSGTALNVANTTIGSGSLEFRSIASNGAANGIVLNTTGSAAGLQVKGTGSAGTGGTIQNSTGPGVSLTSVGSPVSLSYMNIQNGGDDGIRGSTVNGLSLTNVSITSNGNAVGEWGLDLTQLTGSGSMSSCTVSGSAENNVVIANTSGTLSAFNVTNSSFTTTNMTTGDDGFRIENNGTGTMAVSITGSTFTDNKGDHFQAATSAGATGSMNVTFSNNTLTTTASNDANVIGGGITLSPSGSADMTFTVSGNNIQQAFDEAINLNLGTASTAAASMIGTISNNTIGTAGTADSGSESGSGISVISNGAGLTTVSVTGNQVFQYANPYGILLNIKEGSTSMNATVTGNTVSSPGTFAINGIRVDAGATAGDSGTLCATITGNSVAGSGPSTDTDIRLRQRFSTTIRLPGYGGANNDTTAVNAFVAGNNAGSDVSSVENVAGGGGGFVGGAACPIP